MYVNGKVVVDIGVGAGIGFGVGVRVYDCGFSWVLNRTINNCCTRVVSAACARRDYGY